MKLLAANNINLLGVVPDADNTYIVLFEYQWQRRGRYDSYAKAVWSKDFIRTKQTDLDKIRAEVITRVGELRLLLEKGVED